LRLVEEAAPRVTENTTDSKKHMEEELKKACENLIASQTQFLIGSLLSLFNKLGNNNDNQQPEGTLLETDSIEELRSILKTLVEDTTNTDQSRTFRFRLTLVISTNALYLENKLTEKILFNPVKDTLFEVFKQLKFYIDQKLPTTSDLRSEMEVAISHLESILQMTDNQWNNLKKEGEAPATPTPTPTPTDFASSSSTTSSTTS